AGRGRAGVPPKRYSTWWEHNMRSVVRAACAALVIAIGPSASATVLVPIDLGALSRDATTIARGRVVSVEGRWSDDRRRIESVVTLAVDETLKGTADVAVQFAVPGGRIGRYRSVTIGSPEFAAGQEVVVFLGGRPPLEPHLIGFSQGVFRLQRGADGVVV